MTVVCFGGPADPTLSTDLNQLTVDDPVNVRDVRVIERGEQACRTGGSAFPDACFIPLMPNVPSLALIVGDSECEWPALIFAVVPLNGPAKLVTMSER